MWRSFSPPTLQSSGRGEDSFERDPKSTAGFPYDVAPQMLGFAHSGAVSRGAAYSLLPALIAPAQQTNAVAGQHLLPRRQTLWRAPTVRMGPMATSRSAGVPSPEDSGDEQTNGRRDFGGGEDNEFDDRTAELGKNESQGLGDEEAHEEDMATESEQSTMNVYKNSTGRMLPFQGDELPFDVTVVSPPPHSLGRFMLNPRTNCGDVIEHDDKSYVVKRVVCHYHLQFGRPKMFKKTIEIKSLARKSLESYLEKTFRES